MNRTCPVRDKTKKWGQQIASKLSNSLPVRQISQKQPNVSFILGLQRRHGTRQKYTKCFLGADNLHENCCQHVARRLGQPGPGCLIPAVLLLEEKGICAPLLGEWSRASEAPFWLPAFRPRKGQGQTPLTICRKTLQNTVRNTYVHAAAQFSARKPLPFISFATIVPSWACLSTMSTRSNTCTRICAVTAHIRVWHFTWTCAALLALVAVMGHHITRLLTARLLLLVTSKSSPKKCAPTLKCTKLSRIH